MVVFCCIFWRYLLACLIKETPFSICKPRGRARPCHHNSHRERMIYELKPIQLLLNFIIFKGERNDSKGGLIAVY